MPANLLKWTIWSKDEVDMIRCSEGYLEFNEKYVYKYVNLNICTDNYLQFIFVKYSFFAIYLISNWNQDGYLNYLNQ